MTPPSLVLTKAVSLTRSTRTKESFTMWNEHGQSQGNQHHHSIPPHSIFHAQEYQQEQLEANAAKSNETKKHPAHKIITGAAVVGGVTGLVVAGPLIGIVGGVVAGSLAATKGPGGNLSRAAGEVVVSATERAQKLNEQHHIVQHSKEAAGRVVEGAKAIDEKHHVVEKSKTVAGNAFSNAKKFEENHRVLEKATDGLTKSLTFVSNKLRPKER